MTPAPGLIVNRKYRLLRPLGEGGMGMVWVARHEQLDIDVAVKLMSPALASAPSLAARFEREAKAAAQLKSPHVVHILDYGVEDGSPYIVMDLLIGEDLSSLLDRQTRASPAFAAEVVSQTAKALRVAHDAGIVHRDLKPANIFLERAAGDLLVKILDFGIAKELRSGIEGRNQTTTGLVLGSPLYMSPEQARGASVGPSSDLWSLAVVAFEMLTGVQPFDGASVGDVIAKICGDRLPVASHAAPWLTPEVDAFFARALERDPAMRFGSARELADAFAGAMATCPSRISAHDMPRERGPAASAETIPAPEGSTDPSPGGTSVPLALVARDEGAPRHATTTVTDAEVDDAHALLNRGAKKADGARAGRSTSASTEPTATDTPLAAASTSPPWRRAALAVVVTAAVTCGVYMALTRAQPDAGPLTDERKIAASASMSPSVSPAAPSIAEPSIKDESSTVPILTAPLPTAPASVSVSPSVSASARRPVIAPRASSTSTAKSPNPFF